MSLQCSRLSTAHLPTSTLPWSQPERVRPPFAQSADFHRPPGVSFIPTGGFCSFCSLTSEVTRRLRGNKCPGCVLPLAIFTTGFSQIRGAGGRNKQCRPSCSGESCLHSDRRHNPLFHHLECYFLVIFIPWIVFLSFDSISDRGRCSFIAKPLTPAANGEPR